MVLQKLFAKKEYEFDDSDDYLEVNVTDLSAPIVNSLTSSTTSPGRVGIKIEKLTEFGDTEKVLKAIREENIVFLKIKGLKDKDIGELKRAVERLKKTVSAQNGDIVGIEQDWLILAPEFAQVHR